MFDFKVSGYTFTAVGEEGAWLPARIDLGTGETITLKYPLNNRDDAIDYARENFD